MPHQVQVRHTVLCTLQGKPSPCRGLVPGDPISKCGSSGFTEWLPGTLTGSTVPCRPWLGSGLCASLPVAQLQAGKVRSWAASL